MPNIGKIYKDAEGTKSFENYEERLQQFSVANGIDEDKVVGPLAFGILWNLLQPTLPKDKRDTEIINTLKGHFNPKSIVISQRFNFNKQNQKEGEKVSEYVIELKHLCTNCSFHWIFTR